MCQKELESVDYREGCEDIGDKYVVVTFPYLLHLFFSNGLTNQPAGPICTHHGSNDSVWLKKVPLGVTVLQNSV